MAKNCICTTCGHVGQPKRITKGKFLTEVVLWLLVIIPGIVYTMWRVMTRYDACPQCQTEGMIPVTTPMGQQLLCDSRRLEGLGTPTQMLNYQFSMN